MKRRIYILSHSVSDNCTLHDQLLNYQLSSYCLGYLTGFLYQETGSDDESDGDDTSDDDDDDDDDDAKESIDPLFKVDLQAALGNALANEPDDENEAEQSDSDFDDDTMMKLDEALSEVFKQHLKAKQEKKKMKGDLTCINACVCCVSKDKFG